MLDLLEEVDGFEEVMVVSEAPVKQNRSRAKSGAVSFVRPHTPDASPPQPERPRVTPGCTDSVFARPTSPVVLSPPLSRTSRVRSNPEDPSITTPPRRTHSATHKAHTLSLNIAQDTLEGLGHFCSINGIKNKNNAGPSVVFAGHVEIDASEKEVEDASCKLDRAAVYAARQRARATEISKQGDREDVVWLISRRTITRAYFSIQVRAVLSVPDRSKATESGRLSPSPPDSPAPASSRVRPRSRGPSDAPSPLARVNASALARAAMMRRKEEAQRCQVTLQSTNSYLKRELQAYLNRLPSYHHLSSRSQTPFRSSKPASSSFQITTSSTVRPSTAPTQTRTGFWMHTRYV